MSPAPLRVLVETARLTIGGGVQVALEQLRHLEADPRLRCSWRVSQRLLEEIDAAGVPRPADYTVAPAALVPQLRQFRALRRALRPDVVYTVFGPPHNRVGGVPHVSGFAYGWMMFPDNLATTRMRRGDVVRQRLGDVLRRPLLRHAQYYVVETEVARVRLLSMTGLPDDHIRVASNTCADVFRTFVPGPLDPRFARRSPDEALFLVLSSHYPHKHLEFVPAVAQVLRQSGGRPFRFLLTLDPEGAGWRGIAADAARRGVVEQVQTVGPLRLTECPGAYAACDALFLPTLLETFTASYPEAMQMERPIVTSDLPFARDICQDAAAFYSALDPQEAAAKLRGLDAPGAREALVRNGRRRLGEFQDSKGRAAIVVELLHHAARG